MRAALVHCLLVAAVVAQDLTDDTVAKVRTNLASGAKQSWELGTRAQAILELDAPQLSVFAAHSIPASFSQANATALADIVAIADGAVSKLPADDTPRPLDSGAGGDPPSMGIAVLLASATGGPNATRYSQAAQNQLAFVLSGLPRAPDGAISHRAEQVQLWADFVYMTPPFIAYYGAATGNKTLIDIAYQQCSLYRDNLHDKKTNVWQHMALGQSNDVGLWATGNGWAAGGMLRVLATMAQSSFAGDFKGEMSDLEHWVTEILDGMYAHLDTGSLLFPNYINQDGTFFDGSSTALIAAATYRLSVLRSVHHHLPDAERVRKGLVARVDSDGWLAPVVNPESFAKEGTHSPEGEAFVLLMHAAHRDWVADGSQGANGALSARGAPPPRGVLAALALGQIAWLLARRAH